MVILSVVMNMRKNELRNARLYFVSAVLLLTAVCIVVYTSMRDRQRAEEHFQGFVQEQSREPQDDSANVQPVNSLPQRKDTGQQQQDTKEDSKTASLSAPVVTTYTLAVTDGCLQVYVASTGQLYMETSIAYDLLPEDVQKQIDAGKNFESEEALLEFLENYSS